MDTGRAEACNEAFVEGVHRCVPDSAVAAFTYSDDRCTQRLVEVLDPACGLPPTLALRRLDCGVSLSAVGARYDGRWSASARASASR